MEEPPQQPRRRKTPAASKWGSEPEARDRNKDDWRRISQDAASLWPPPRASTTGRIRELRRLIQKPRSFKNAIVLSEILGKPVSERDPDRVGLF